MLGQQKRYYLNTSSTNYPITHELNMSDVLYDENIKARKDVENLEYNIKKQIGASETAHVIFNSGATESIATCIHWAKCINPYSIVVGSKFDHSAVKENSKLYEMDYVQLNTADALINDKAGAIFITQVDSKTGEIFDMNTFLKNIRSYQYLTELDSDYQNFTYRNLLQTRPLMVLDATQSMMKLPIKMAEWGFDAVFWSNHKLGGQMGRGVLVIDDKHHKFYPLIAGSQNEGRRGGSLSTNLILRDADIYCHNDDINKRKKYWTAACEFLEQKGVKVYKPKGRHLYNTILIDTQDKCPYAILSELSKCGIYLSPKSACMAEKQLNDTNGKMIDNKKNNKVVGGNENKELQPFDNAIRLSFTDGKQFDGFALNTIAKTITESFTIDDNNGLDLY